MKVGGKLATTLCMGVALFFFPGRCGAATDPDAALKLLEEQNALLQVQLEKQGKVIDSLSAKVANLEASDAKRSQEVAELKSEKPDDAPAPAPEISHSFDMGKVHISGEGAVAFFESDKHGSYPNAEFRVDEAKLFVEAPVWKDVYFYTELNLATHENDGLALQLGELYLDFEDVSKLWGQDRQLNIRAGQMDIPFGEEYLYRDAIDDPLISHSLTDIWGVDEGVELYGSFGKFSYAFAVQNGGTDADHDFNADKAVVARLAYDPTRWLHLSISGMRTGDLNVGRDMVSAMWFGTGWVRSLGSTNTTKFSANLVEGDVIISLPRGRIHAFGGYVSYDDNDPMANNQQNIFYYSVEGIADLTKKFYVGGRFSQIIADRGFPIAANGNFDEYFNSTLTRDIWRMSAAVGYRFSSQLVLKGEYTYEQGQTVGGGNRSDNQFAAEAAFGF